MVVKIKGRQPPLNYSYCSNYDLCRKEKHDAHNKACSDKSVLHQ